MQQVCKFIKPIVQKTDNSTKIIVALFASTSNLTEKDLLLAPIPHLMRNWEATKRRLVESIMKPTLDLFEVIKGRGGQLIL